MGQIIDLIGNVYGRWTVVGMATSVAPIMWDCICSCGTRRDVFGGDLKRSRSISCGCERDEKSAARLMTHGLAGHPANQTWRHMKNRCENPKNDGFYLYGGRGISVCDKWSTFEGFWSDMGSTWGPGLSIDRKDTNGNYEVENCKWSTSKEQANNRRTNKFVTIPDGRTMTVAEAAEATGLTYQTLSSRIRYGWTGNDLFKPARPTKRIYK